MSFRGRRTSLTVTGLLVAATWMLTELCATPSKGLPEPPGLAQPASRPGIVGAGRCSARACHGAIEPPAEQTKWQNAYTTWRTNDKHANAYEVLFDKRSQRIAKNLQAASGPAVPAEQDPRCLACHSIAATAVDSGELASWREDGVSCESCHGPAARWVVPHTTQRWVTLTQEEKEQQYGMTATRNLRRRAQLCAGCHVGAPANPGLGVPERDAYHDILAAGHPRLSFEFASFLANMPRHWTEKEDQSDFEVRVWTIGQLASARAALALLESRARASDRPWPEFAEYGCFACHHELREELGKTNWRQWPGDPNRAPGSLPWGTWYLALTQAIASYQPEPNRGVISQLNDLEKLMSGGCPDRQAVALQAHALSESLNDWLSRAELTRYDRESVRRLVALLAQRAQQPARRSWDSKAQLYLALVALNQAYGDEQIRTALQGMFERLQFPKGYESPRDFQPKDIEAELIKIRPRLGE